MAIPTLSGSYIDETYGRLVQVSGSEFADGLGNPISIVLGSYTSQQTIIGDYNQNYNGTKLTVDDNNQKVKINKHLEVELGSIVPYYTTTLNLSDIVYYDIPYSGIFEIVNPNGRIAFPNPETNNGGTIIIVNTTEQPVSINNENGWAPLRSGTGNSLDTINANEMWNCISIGAKWRGMLGVLP